MIKQEFEKFVRDNRESFDLKEPRAELWYEIDQKIQRKKPARVFSLRVMGIAASIVLLLGIGFGAGFIIKVNSSDNRFYTQSSQINDFPEVEKYYLTQIDNKTTELQEIGVEPSVEENLKQLDDIYEELKQEFLDADGQDKDMIIDAMIKNYQTKIEILELILGRSKQAIDQQKTSENETIKI